MENQINPSIVGIPQNVTEAPKQNNFLVVLLSVLLLLSILIAGFFAYQTQNLVKELQLVKNNDELSAIETSSPTQVPEMTETPNTNDEVGWKTYTDLKYNFSIKYPSGWRMASGDKFVGFGPAQIGEDILWAINIYDNTSTTLDMILNDLGKQLSDRKQTQTKIEVNGIAVTRVITTTNSSPDWYLENIVFEDNKNFVVVSNGAIKDSNLQKMTGVPFGITFKDFYSTFKFTN